MAGKTTKTSAASLEDALWESANLLRSSMDAAEYKHVVLGLIFLKYISDVFEQQRQKLDTLSRDDTSDFFTPSDAAREAMLEDRDEYTGDGVFWVPEGHRWHDLRNAAKQADIGRRIDDAMEAIEKENLTLKGVLPKNYSRRELTPATLGGLIDLFSNEDLAAKEHESLDVLGRVFEYMLSKFASAEGKRGGQYFTPRGVVELMVDMLEPFRGRVYDPACGSGGMFVQAERFVKAHNGQRNDISVFGQEDNPTTWRLAKMNLALRGIEANLGPEWGDSFTNDQHPDLRADFVIANPPFNSKGWGAERLVGDVRWKHGTPPENNANFAWVQHMLHHLAPTGSMATLLANGSLSSRSGGEDTIRRALIAADLVECIVSLPPQLFTGTPIPVSLWFLTKYKSAQAGANERLQRSREGEVLFMDARTLGTKVSSTLKELTEDDITLIAGTFHAWRGEPGEKPYEDVPGFCASVSLEQIADHGHVLTPGRYVGSEEAAEDAEPLDEKIARLAAEVSEGFEVRAELQERVLVALASLQSEVVDE